MQTRRLHEQVRQRQLDALERYDRDGYLTKAEVAQLGAVSIRTVERAIKSGKLKSVKVGRAVRIRRAWAQLWLSLIALLVVLCFVTSPRLGCGAMRAILPPVKQKQHHHRVQLSQQHLERLTLRGDVLHALTSEPLDVYS